MEKENIILTKTYAFALRIVKLYRFLREEKKEYELSKQLLKSGTSIGANCEEGSGAQSRKDFISKYSIALKEAREARFWLRILRDSDYIEVSTANSYITECEEILKIITAIIKTTKQTS
jgi:four helix bundle protein